MIESILSVTRSRGARRLRAVAAEPFLVAGTQITLSAAVGSCPAHLADPAALLHEADLRMYETNGARCPWRPRAG